FWQQRFGGDPSIVGRRLNLDAKPYNVVGVMPAAFDFPEHMQFWIPAGLSYDAWNKRPRSVHFMEAVGEMKPGVTLARAQSELGAIADELARKYPTTNEGFGVALTDLHDDAVAETYIPHKQEPFRSWTVTVTYHGRSGDHDRSA